jgi:hypothetical protein
MMPILELATGGIEQMKDKTCRETDSIQCALDRSAVAQSGTGNGRRKDRILGVSNRIAEHGLEMTFEGAKPLRKCLRREAGVSHL